MQTRSSWVHFVQFCGLPAYATPNPCALDRMTMPCLWLSAQKFTFFVQLCDLHLTSPQVSGCGWCLTNWLTMLHCRPDWLTWCKQGNSWVHLACPTSCMQRQGRITQMWCVLDRTTMMHHRLTTSRSEVYLVCATLWHRYLPAHGSRATGQLHKSIMQENIPFGQLNKKKITD